MSLKVEQVEPPNSDWDEAVRRGLQAYNREQVGSREFHELSLIIRNETGEVVGGLLGGSIWGWLLIDTLWVDVNLRNQDYGHQLLTQAESIAQERGCQHIILETFSFQALPFYQKHGYVIYGQLDGFPAQHTRYSLKKDLQKNPIPAEPATFQDFHRNMYYVPVAPIIEQARYQDMLYEITLDLLKRQEREDLLQRIVDHAATFLDAPYGEIMLREGDELVVLAFTRNQPNLLGDRVKRGQSLVSWRAYDSRQPVLIDDYFAWSGKRILYDENPLQAVADFPIVRGETSLGVLAMGRTQPNYPFSPEDVQRGMQLAQLTALVLDNANLYQTALTALKQAEDARRARSLFFASLSHELRTPLTAVLGFTSLLLDEMEGEANSETRHYLGRIQANGQNLLALIGDILDLAKIESTKVDLQMIPFSPVQLAQAWYSQIYILAEKKGLTFTLEAETNLPNTLYGDPDRISQIIRNLLANAFKFTTQGEVKLSVTSTEGYWIIKIKDSGMGMAPEFLEHIFEEFTQVSKTGSSQEGSGLGLAISHKLCQLMGGKIEVESSLGVGTTFTVSLPLKTQAEPK